MGSSEMPGNKLFMPQLGMETTLESKLMKPTEKTVRPNVPRGVGDVLEMGNLMAQC